MMGEPIRTTTNVYLVSCHKRMNVISSTQAMEPDDRRLLERVCREICGRAGLVPWFWPRHGRFRRHSTAYKYGNCVMAGAPMMPLPLAVRSLNH